ncbi:MAG: murein biosynthesis integral membrane protein MurJ [Defluviitaleaceae bacterium]|nr:murein biosynthesis integral membrane protein MurJ [Defluviitaleaceae bacterium]
MSKTLFAVTAITLLSRLLSLVSLQVYMAFFGPHNIQINIFSYALNIPNIIFNVVGTIIAAVIVPIYTGLLTKDKEQSRIFIKNVITLVCLAVVVLVAIGYIGAPFLANLTAYRDYPFMVYALRVKVFAMFFYGLHYMFQGILHSHGKFLLAAFVTVPTSIIVIGYVFFFGHSFGVHGLVYAMVIGLSFQAFLLLPAVIRLGLRYRPALDFKNPQVQQALQLSVPVLLSVVSFQINSIFNNTLATGFNLVLIMGFVQNLMLVLILSLVHPIMNVYLPKLSRIWETGQTREFRTSLENAILTVLFFLIPASVGFFMLQFEIINLLAAWGEFTTEDAVLTASLLGLYGLGVVSIGLKEVMDRGFYAQKNSKLPGFVGFFIMAVNIGFSLATVNYLGFYTMPISFVISTSLGSLCLIIVMHKNIAIISKRLVFNVAKFLAGALLMGLVLYVTRSFFDNIVFNNEVFTRAVRLFAPVILGVVIYFACATVFVKEFRRYLK